MILLMFQVPYGVVIPIQIKALCAVPYLVSNMPEINFGSVRCGDKIVCSIPLKNVYVTNHKSLFTLNSPPHMHCPA